MTLILDEPCSRFSRTQKEKTMTEKPFWAYDMAEIMTPQLAEDIGHDIYRAWTGEEPPKTEADDAGNNAV